MLALEVVVERPLDTWAGRSDLFHANRGNATREAHMPGSSEDRVATGLVVARSAGIRRGVREGGGQGHSSGRSPGPGTDRSVPYCGRGWRSTRGSPAYAVRPKPIRIQGLPACASYGGPGGVMKSVADRLAHYHEHGYVILDGALSPSEIDDLRTALQPYLELGMRGRNDFEGERTQRVYSLIGRGAPFERSAEHPMVMELLNELLLPNFLLTASQAICIHPGETPQPVHCDDQFCWLARPRPPLSVSHDLGTRRLQRENGGTLVIPGSHRWSDEEVAASIGPGDAFDEWQCQHRDGGTRRDAGWLIGRLFRHTLPRWRRNRSSALRRAFSHQYCEPWVRQQENFTLSIPQDRVKEMSPRLRQMLGYSIHPPFVGQIAGRHPEKALAADFQNSLIVDDAENRLAVRVSKSASWMKRSSDSVSAPRDTNRSANRWRTRLGLLAFGCVLAVVLIEAGAAGREPPGAYVGHARDARDLERGEHSRAVSR